MNSVAREGEILWSPSASVIETANVEKFRRYVCAKHGLALQGYGDLWRWTIDDTASFWGDIWHYFGIGERDAYISALTSSGVQHARWFSGARLNYAEVLLSRCGTDKIAAWHQSEVRRLTAVTGNELRAKVVALASWLRKVAGIEPGDRIVSYMPNTIEALVGMLATTAVGAVWSSCSPELGIRSVIDRFAQITPKVLFVVDGYRYGNKDFDRRAEIRQLRAALPELRETVGVDYLNIGSWAGDSAIHSWDSTLEPDWAAGESFRFESVPFDHPLWVLYSSGTTGLPKGIVHSHGGIVVEHFKLLSFHINLSPSSVLFWFTTTSWTMWNVLVGGLFTGATIVLYDGNPNLLDDNVLFDLAESTGVTFFGTSAAFINALSHRGFKPSLNHTFAALEGVGVTGSPLSPEGFNWVYNNIHSNLWLTSISGGTDICSAFVGGVPSLPVRSGEIQARCLGVSAHSLDPRGHQVIEAVGELVVMAPMPSMPIFFWNDPDGSRYQESYFDMYPGLWRHGDFIEIKKSGACIIRGRSDSTLNRFGIRIGTAEIYRIVETIAGVRDSLIVNLDLPDGRFYMPLFVVLDDGITLDNTLRGTIVSEIRRHTSGRHLPDEILQAPAIPYTITGKKLEVPVRRILMGTLPNDAVNRDATLDPSALDFYIAMSRSKIAKLLC